MNESLYRHLIAGGVGEEKAAELSKGFTGDVAPAENDVDVERLQKALDGVAESMNSDHQARVDDAVREANDVAEAVTKGADALLSEVQSQNDALAKGLLAIGEEVRAVRDFLLNQSTTVAVVQNSVEEVKKSLNEPLAPKSVNTAATAIPSPQDAGTENKPADLINKALAELQSGEATQARQYALRKAIVQIESGVPFESVQETLRLH